MKFLQSQQPIAKASKAAYIPWNAMALTIKRVQRKEINRLHSICIKLWWGPRRGFSNPRMVTKGFGSLRLWTLNPVNMAISSVLHTLSPNSKFKIKRKMTWNPGFSLEQTIILANNGMIYWICDIKQKQCIKSKELRKKEHWRTNMGDIEILWSPIMYGWVWVFSYILKYINVCFPLHLSKPSPYHWVALTCTIVCRGVSTSSSLKITHSQSGNPPLKMKIFWPAPYFHNFPILDCKVQFVKHVLAILLAMSYFNVPTY